MAQRATAFCGEKRTDLYLLEMMCPHWTLNGSRHTWHSQPSRVRMYWLKSLSASCSLALRFALRLNGRLAFLARFAGFGTRTYRISIFAGIPCRRLASRRRAFDTASPLGITGSRLYRPSTAALIRDR